MIFIKLRNSDKLAYRYTGLKGYIAIVLHNNSDRANAPYLGAEYKSLRESQLTEILTNSSHYDSANNDNVYTSMENSDGDYSDTGSENVEGDEEQVKYESFDKKKRKKKRRRRHRRGKHRADSDETSDLVEKKENCSMGACLFVCLAPFIWLIS